jgi:hypothetical protein
MSERHQQRLGARTRGKSLFSVLGRGQIGCRFSGCHRIPDPNSRGDRGKF